MHFYHTENSTSVHTLFYLKYSSNLTTCFEGRMPQKQDFYSLHSHGYCSISNTLFCFIFYCNITVATHSKSKLNTQDKQTDLTNIFWYLTINYQIYPFQKSRWLLFKP